MVVPLGLFGWPGAESHVVRGPHQRKSTVHGAIYSGRLQCAAEIAQSIPLPGSVR